MPHTQYMDNYNPWANPIPHQHGEGEVVFTLKDDTTVSFDYVRVDSVSPGAEAFGVVGVEFYGSDRVVHIPFVKFWEFNYRY